MHGTDRRFMGGFGRVGARAGGGVLGRDILTDVSVWVSVACGDFKVLTPTD